MLSNFNGKHKEKQKKCYQTLMVNTRKNRRNVYKTLMLKTRKQPIMNKDTWLKEYCKMNCMSRIQYDEGLQSLPVTRAMLTRRMFNRTTSDRNISWTLK